MYVKVKSQLGKGGSALVFKGSVVKDPSFSSSSSSSSSSVRRSSRLGQQQHNTRFGNTIFNTSNSSENEAEDSIEELKLKLKSKTKTKTSSKRKQNNDNDNDNEDIGMEVALKVVARNDASSHVFPTPLLQDLHHHKSLNRSLSRSVSLLVRVSSQMHYASRHLCTNSLTGTIVEIQATCVDVHKRFP
jgi:hypothetical protein